MRPARACRSRLGTFAIASFLTALAGCNEETLNRPTVEWAHPHGFRLELTVDVAGVERRDHPVVIELPLVATVVELGGEGAISSVAVAELDGEGRLVDPAVPFQLDATGELVLWLAGRSGPEETRRFHVYFDTERTDPPPSFPRAVVRAPNREHEGQDSVVAETPSGVWIYHRRGAGFASLIDRDGRDWISYHPTGGSAGHFRGIPNLVHPEGYFHPGGTECETRTSGEGPLRVELLSTCGNGWETRWEIYPDFAALTVVRAPADYWFLYEGTPGGELDDADFVVLSDGRRLPATERWDDDIASPEWLYFGDEAVGRALVLAHHSDDRFADAYYPMQGNMTVFGFGRRRLEKFLSEAPGRFTVGLVDELDPAAIAPVVLGWMHPLDVSLGRAERRPG